jgi:CheY-like chemotaxis protein
MKLKKKLKNVLLIDDSESDNFYHKRKISKLGITDNIKVTYSGEEALEYLITELNGEFPQPTLIFLDINMPGMNGWEFLEKYEELDIAHKGEIVLTMLSNSQDPRDISKGNNYKSLKGYYSKPLQDDYLEAIVMKHFPDYLED